METASVATCLHPFSRNCALTRQGCFHNEFSRNHRDQDVIVHGETLIWCKNYVIVYAAKKRLDNTDNFFILKTGYN